MKYNFIILGSPWEFYTNASYKDVINLSNVEYRSCITNNFVLRKLINLHHNVRLNKIINIPYKNIYNYLLIKNPFDKNDKLCYVVFYDWICRNIKVLETIRKIYPNAKIVVVFNDLIRAKRLNYTNAPIDIKRLKSLCNLIISFDFEESKIFGLEYHSVPYSKPQAVGNYIEDICKPEYDVYFLGQAKNRLSRIMATYHALKSMHLKLNFILANVPFKNRIDQTDIKYIDGVGISYNENIHHICNSRCLLEIMQQNGTGYTSRTLEAIAYGKKLLTDNSNIIDAPFYNKKYISYFKSPEMIDNIFANHIVSDDSFIDYKYIDNLSPIKFLEFIEHYLI